MLPQTVLAGCLSIATLAPLTQAGDVFVVGPTSLDDYSSIQPAINAASDGDLIVIRRKADPTSPYGPIRIDGKGVTIRAVSGAGIPTGQVTVANLDFGMTVLLGGLAINSPGNGTPSSSSQGASLLVKDSAGAVRIESCSAFGDNDEPAARILSALDVTLNECVIVGGRSEPGLDCSLSRVGIYDSTITGGWGHGDFQWDGAVVGGDGGAGVSLGARCFAWIGNSSIRGGQGGSAYCAHSGSNCGPYTPGDGGPGLVTGPTSVVMNLANSIEGGTGGQADGVPWLGATGPAEVGVSYLVPGEQRVLEAASSVRSDELLSIRVEGVPGESVEIFAATDGWFRFLGWQWGVWSVRSLTGASPIALGPIPSSGVLEAQIDLGTTGLGSAETFAIQAVARTSPTRFRTTPVRIVSVIGADVPTINPGIVYVDADAAPGGTGDSWERAFNNLQAALVSPTYQAGDNPEIWIAEGRYSPASPGGNRGRSFSLLAGTQLYGGFQGTESSPSDRIPGLYETILDGDLNGDDAPFAEQADATRDDNSHCIIRVGQLDPTAAHLNAPILDGLTIRGAESVNLLSAITVKGSVTLRNCDVHENRAQSNGGALRVQSNTQNSNILTIDRCRFRRNVSLTFGGALWWRGNAVRISNSAIVGNTSSNYSAGINCQLSSSPFESWMVSTTVTGNHGTTCPVFITAASDIRFSSNIIWGNIAPASPNCPVGIQCSDQDHNTFDHAPSICLINGNQIADPLFVDAYGPDGISGTDDDDLRLSPGSPCIDAGDSTAFVGAAPIDLAGNPRFVNDPLVPDTGVGGTRIIDHGAYERQ